MPLRASDIAIINQYTRAELTDTIFVGNFFMLKSLLSIRRSVLSFETPSDITASFTPINVETFLYTDGDWQTRLYARVEYQGTGLKRVGELDVYVSSYTFYVNSETTADISVPNEVYGTAFNPLEIDEWFEITSGDSSGNNSENHIGEYGTWVYYNGNIFRLTGISLSTTYPHLLKIQAELDYYDLFDTQLTNPYPLSPPNTYENLGYILAGNAIRQSAGVPPTSQFLTTQNGIQITAQTGANIKT